MNKLSFFLLSVFLLCACETEIMPPSRCPGEACNGRGTCDDKTGVPICKCDQNYTGHKCQECAAGFKDYGDGVCRPADPCTEDTHCQDEQRECVNDEGSAECGECLEDFTDYGDGVCKPVDPCSPNPCSESHKTRCTNKRGNADCICDSGYTGDNCDACADGYIGFPECVDDPCLPDPCNNHGSCNQGNCTCDLGYDGANCESCEVGYERNDQEKCVRYEYQCSDSGVCGADVLRRECIADKCGGYSLVQVCGADQECWANQQGAGCTNCEIGCLKGKCKVCEIGSGPCCDDSGQHEPETEACDEVTSYRCTGNACGDDVQEKAWKRFCDGKSHECMGDITEGAWETRTVCGLHAYCSEKLDSTAIPTCEVCEYGCSSGECSDCSGGVCCDSTNHFKDKGAECDDWTEFRCSTDQCGAETQYREMKQFCSGLSNECNGEISNTSWLTNEICDDVNDVCETDETTYAQCKRCQENGFCRGGSCFTTWNWITISGGSFMMGSNSGNSDELPIHEVNVPTFEMTQTEVTVSQYKSCVNEGACSAPNTGGSCNWTISGRDDHPVNCVSWDQVVAFCDWAGGRLPSEAEWEYAARSGGQDITYPWGNEFPTCDYCVMDDGGHGCGQNRTWAVCSKPAGNTDHGLCDMAGNVSEWVQDWYHKSYDGAPSDGSAWEEPAGTWRIARGGRWSNKASYLRASNRGINLSGYRADHLGFRCARD